MSDECGAERFDTGEVMGVHAARPGALQLALGVVGEEPVVQHGVVDPQAAPAQQRREALLGQPTGPNAALYLSVTSDTEDRLVAASTPVAEAVDLVGQMAAHDREALARAKKLLDGAVTASPRRTFARERRAQLRLLARMDRSGLPGR